MPDTKKYDAIIIGAGQSGGPLSTALARAGRKTALIERKHVGGSCINFGCTPTKTMVASARVAHLARRAADYGVDTGKVAIDMEKIRQRKRDIVDSFRSGSRKRIEETEGVDLLMGEARFAGSKALQVRLNDGGTLQLTAETILINTGTRTATPKIDGLHNITALDSGTIMELDAAPGHLLIIGGGYIGLEFGQMFRRFGSEVTIVQRAGQLLPREDADIAGEIATIFRDDGITVLLESEARQVEKTADGKIRMTVAGKSANSALTGSHLLLAAGRAPNTDALNLPAAGIETDARGFVKVNRRLETNVDGIYAIGDVNGGPAFTHISYDDYRILTKNLLEGGSATTANRYVPYTVFIDPQLGRVGLTEKEAKAQGKNFKVAKMPMSHVARALEVDETRGMMKAVIDTGTEQILGCAILGIEGGELAGVLQMAMMGGVPYTAIRDGVFSHPTLTESLNTLFTL